MGVREARAWRWQARQSVGAACAGRGAHSCIEHAMQIETTTNVRTSDRVCGSSCEPKYSFACSLPAIDGTNAAMKATDVATYAASLRGEW